MLRFGAKVPGLGLDVRSVTMDFTYGSAFSVDSPDAYETLILDALQGDASLFTRADEVEEAWGIVDPYHRRVGERTATRFPELRRRHVGPGRACGRDDRPRGLARMASRCRRRHAQRARPALVGAGAQHRRHREGAVEDLGQAGPDHRMEGQPGRHVAARTSVMNLVVIARRPEIARTRSCHDPGPDRQASVADDRRPVGRSRRPVVDRRARRGALHPAARGRPGDLRRDDPPDRRRRGRATSVSDRHAADRPRPADHGLVAGRTAVLSPSFARPVRASDRLVVDGSTWSGDGLARLAEMASLAEKARLAVSDFALMRQSRWREAIASIFDDPDFLPYLRSLRRISVTYGDTRRDRRPGDDEPRQTRLPRRVAGIAARI